MTDISVIIPVRGEALYLEQCLESVVAQTQPCQDIVIVGHPEDKPLNLTPFKSTSIRYLIHTSMTANAAAQRNLGVIQSSSKYLAFLDADDVWPSERIEKLLYSLISTDVDVVFGSMHTFETHLNLGLVDKKTASLLSLGLISKSTFLKYGLFDEDLSVGETIEWWGRAKASGIRASFIDDIVLFRRKHSRNLTSKRDLVNQDYLRALNKVIQSRQ